MADEGWTAAPARLGQALEHAWRANVFHYAASLAFLQGAPFLVQAACARLLGPDDFGRLRVLETILGILLIPAGLGLSSAIVRYGSLAVGREQIEGYLGRALAVSTGFGVLFAGVAAALLLILPIESGLRFPLLVLVWSLPVTNATRIALNYLQARQRVREVVGLNVLSAIVAFAFAVGGAWFAQLNGWTWGRVAGAILPAVLLAVLLRSEIGRLAPKDAFRPMLRFGLLMAFSLGVDKLAGTADTLYIQAFLGQSGQVGQYGAASLALQAASLLPVAAIGLAVPRLAGMAGDVVELVGFIRRHVGVYLVALVGLTLGLAVFGPPAVLAGLGPSYGPAAQLIPVLAPSLLLIGLLQAGGAMLIAFDRGDLAVLQSLTGLGLNVALNAFLLPSYGLWGAAVAAVLTQAARLVLMWFLVRSAMGRARGVAG